MMKVVMAPVVVLHSVVTFKFWGTDLVVRFDLK